MAGDFDRHDGMSMPGLSAAGNDFDSGDLYGNSQGAQSLAGSRDLDDYGSDGFGRATSLGDDLTGRGGMSGLGASTDAFGRDELQESSFGGHELPGSSFERDDLPGSSFARDDLRGLGYDNQYQDEGIMGTSYGGMGSSLGQDLGRSASTKPGASGASFLGDDLHQSARSRSAMPQGDYLDQNSISNDFSLGRDSLRSGSNFSGRSPSMRDYGQDISNTLDGGSTFSSDRSLNPDAGLSSSFRPDSTFPQDRGLGSGLNDMPSSTSGLSSSLRSDSAFPINSYGSRAASKLDDPLPDSFESMAAGAGLPAESYDSMGVPRSSPSERRASFGQGRPDFSQAGDLGAADPASILGNSHGSSKVDRFGSALGGSMAFPSSLGQDMPFDHGQASDRYQGRRNSLTSNDGLQDMSLGSRQSSSGLGRRNSIS